MNGDDDGNSKELSGPGEEEILATWARVITALKASRVCFYPGPRQSQPPDFPDFTAALSLIGDCNALVYADRCRRRQALPQWHAARIVAANPAISRPAACK